MITRIVKVKDYLTCMYFLVTQFEEVDKTECEKIGIAPGFKIINRISGRVVDTFAGYEFDPERYDESIAEQSKKYVPDGTSHAFGLLLNEFEDIRKLPNEVDVEKIRNIWGRLNRMIFMDDGILKTVEENNIDNLRKCLYSRSRIMCIALIDINKNEMIYEQSSTSDLNAVLPRYLWIPVKEAELEYINKNRALFILESVIKPES